MSRSFYGWLWLGVALFFGLTSVGYLPTDPNWRFMAMERLLGFATVELDPTRGDGMLFEGRRYSVFFPGQSLVFAPLAALSAWGAWIPGLPGGLLAQVSRFLAATFWLPLLAAGALVTYLHTLRQLGVSLRVGLGAALALGVATPLWVYASNASEEPTLAFFSILGVSLLLDGEAALARGDRSHTLRRVGQVGVVLALGLLHRGTFAAACLVCLPLYLSLLWRVRSTPGISWGPFLGWTGAAGLLLLIIPLYNQARFGSPWETGYALYYAKLGGAFATPLVTGLRGYLISPGKGIFLYIPWLALVPLALSSPVRRRLGLLGWGILLGTIAHFLVYAKHTFWGGDPAWGVRFHVSMLPVWLLPVGMWLEEVSRHPRTRRVVWTLGVLSAGIQILGLSLPMHLESRQHPEYFSGPTLQVPEGAAWTWEGSGLLLRVGNVAKKLQGQNLLPAEVQGERWAQNAQVWNIFPVRGPALLDKPWAGWVFWALWGGMLAGVILTMRKVWLMSSLDQPPVRRHSGVDTPPKG